MIVLKDNEDVEFDIAALGWAMDTTEHSNEQTRSNPGQQPAEPATAHITFPPVADGEKASRHELRKKWRGPLYTLPLGVLCNTCTESILANQQISSPLAL